MLDGADPSRPALNLAELGRVAVEREMAARTVVVLGVAAQDAAQVLGFREGQAQGLSTYIIAIDVVLVGQ